MNIYKLKNNSEISRAIWDIIQDSCDRSETIFNEGAEEEITADHGSGIPKIISRIPTNHSFNPTSCNPTNPNPTTNPTNPNPTNPNPTTNPTNPNPATKKVNIAISGGSLAKILSSDPEIIVKANYINRL